MTEIVFLTRGRRERKGTAESGRGSSILARHEGWKGLCWLLHSSSEERYRAGDNQLVIFSLMNLDEFLIEMNLYYLFTTWESRQHSRGTFVFLDPFLSVPCEMA